MKMNFPGFFMASMLLAGVFSPTSQADEAGPSLRDLITQSYAQEYSFTQQEAEARLRETKYIGEIASRMENGSPASFAGLYIDNSPNYRVVARFVGEAKQELLKYTNDPLFVAEAAPRSLRSLKNQNATLVNQLKVFGIDFSTSIDIKTSSIDLYVRDPSLVRRSVLTLLPATDMINLHTTTGFLTPTSNFHEGLRLSGGGEFCTSGFNVVDASGELGLTTVTSSQ